ncbi:MAG: hypothetical protein CVU84_15760 [Firmicutes bacterium HGW-Firmicutes-1]|jgi:hypothetical protein|nr:MAG: hypothetical protein CVU84_15760 [Firmicutes bacterium HGW-Firmicutes-1]
MLSSKNVIIWVNIKKGTKRFKLPLSIPFIVFEEIFQSIFDIIDLAGLFIPKKTIDFRNLLVQIYELICSLTREPFDLATIKTPEADVIIKIR